MTDDRPAEDDPTRAPGAPATPRVRATPEALEVIERLAAEHGPLVFLQSGGCCDGSSPMCMRRGELVLGPGDALLGEVGPASFYVDRDQDDRWGHPVYPGVVGELRAGRKTGHWIWFVFPQIAGLGRSEMSRHYAIASLEEARAYLAHPILGPRLRECASLVLAATPGRSAEAILGSIDAIKLRSSMTLFHRAVPVEPVFVAVLDRFYDGQADTSTDAILRAG